MNQILAERKIKALYHFTQAENLQNIFKHGLLSRQDLKEQSIKSLYNDNYRYDGYLNAVCVSIEFPNYKMFYKIRQENKETDWAVLKLDAKILCNLQCAYCCSNAANSAISHIAIEQRMSKTAFLELFENHDDKPTRKKLHIPDKYPTDPQAEVLVFEKIPTKYIKRVYFPNSYSLDKYFNIIPSNIEAQVNCDWFNPRKDWEYWQ